MIENKGSILVLLALIIGASGLGMSIFSAVNFQVVEGPQGLSGQDGLDGIDGINGVDGINGTDGIDGVDGINGTDGEDAPGGFIVRILDPDYGQPISGIVTIRALIYGSEDYSVSILRNGTEIGDSLPMQWDTTQELDRWWNISIKAIDLATQNQSKDEILVYTYNTQVEYVNFYYLVTVQGALDQWYAVCGRTVNLNFEANLFVWFNGYVGPVGINMGADFGFRLDSQSVKYATRVFLNEDTYISCSYIFSNVQSGSHTIALYFKVFEGDTTLRLGYQNYAMFGLTITI